MVTDGGKMDKIQQFEPLFGGWHVESFNGVGSLGCVYSIDDWLKTCLYLTV